MDNLKKWIRHNQAMVAALFICVVLVAVTFGCHPTTRSPFEPDKKVTRAQLDVAVKNYAAEVELAYGDLAAKEMIMKTVLEAGLAVAQGGSVNPLGVASTMLGILGVGAVVDNRRKDAVIKSKSNVLNDLTAKVVFNVGPDEEEQTPSA